MAGPMKMRATLSGGVTDVRVLMTHPMETGQRKDPDGKLVPLHFIQNVTVKLNGKTVVESQISQGVSRNPVFSFRIKGGAPGDKVEVAWLDTKKEIQRYRQMVAEGSPVELFELEGETLWKKPQGPNQVSLEKCDLGLGAGVLNGAYARLPRYFKDADRVMDLESRLLHC